MLTPAGQPQAAMHVHTLHLGTFKMPTPTAKQPIRPATATHAAPHRGPQHMRSYTSYTIALHTVGHGSLYPRLCVHDRAHVGGIGGYQPTT